MNPSRRQPPRPWVLVVVAAASLALMAPTCTASADERRLARVEGMATRVNDQLVILQSTTKGDDQEIAQLRGTIDTLNATVEDLKKELDAAKTSDSSLQKKVDDMNKKLTDLTSKLGAIDQRLWVLESRYNDHLRKYHNTSV